MLLKADDGAGRTGRNNKSVESSALISWRSLWQLKISSARRIRICKILWPCLCLCRNPLITGSLMCRGNLWHKVRMFVIFLQASRASYNEIANATSSDNMRADSVKWTKMFWPTLPWFRAVSKKRKHLPLAAIVEIAWNKQKAPKTAIINTLFVLLWKNEERRKKRARERKRNEGSSKTEVSLCRTEKRNDGLINYSILI